MKKFGCVVLSLLIGTAACSAMAGCGKSYDGEVNVYNWGEYIANGEDGTLDVIDEFEKEYNIKVNYTTYETNEELYNMLGLDADGIAKSIIEFINDSKK